MWGLEAELIQGLVQTQSVNLLVGKNASFFFFQNHIVLIMSIFRRMDKILNDY